ncbi:MAG: PorT family protein [Bacteroidetes bacterium]|nr:PorT family protein [Bacteroidota bacterium]
MKRTSFLLFLLCLGFSVAAQDVGYGFKAGLNFNRVIGPLEQNAQGEALEEYVGNTGFHVGAIFNFKLDRKYGVRAEILYSQKGGRYFYEGPSYYTLYTIDAEEINTTGIREETVNNTLSYVDIPLGFYYRLTSWLEVSAGANVGVLAGANGAGEIIYSGISENSGNVPEFSITLAYDYRRDETGDAAFGSGSEFIKVDGEDIEIPSSAGAYYEIPKTEEPWFSLLDLGAYAGASLYLNKGFFVGVRANYGLIDITSDAYDYSLQSLDENDDFISRSDKDINFSVQASLGFSF